MMTISIYDSKWTVEVVDAHAPELFVNDVYCRGATWCSQQRICISKELSERIVYRVLVHELTHAWIWTTQAIMPETYTEEQICDFVAMYARDIVKMAESIIKELFHE